MIESIWEVMRVHAIWLLVFLALVTVAMVIDLITGIRKSIARGNFTTSCGLRKTITKATKYYMLILCCAIFDFLLSPLPFYTIPYLALLTSAYCTCCEIKSVFENTRDKDEMEDVAKFLSKIIRSKDDSSELLEMIVKQVMTDGKDDEHQEHNHFKNEEEHGNEFE